MINFWLCLINHEVIINFNNSFLRVSLGGSILKREKKRGLRYLF